MLFISYYIAILYKHCISYKYFNIAYKHKLCYNGGSKKVKVFFDYADNINNGIIKVFSHTVK